MLNYTMQPAAYSRRFPELSPLPVRCSAVGRALGARDASISTVGWTGDSDANSVLQIPGQLTDLAVALTDPRAGVFPRRRAVRRAACLLPEFSGDTVVLVLRPRHRDPATIPRRDAARDRMSLRKTDLIRAPQHSPSTNQLCQYTRYGFAPNIQSRTAALTSD